MRYLATRFSAKEAFSKAIGLGMRMPMTWRLCEVGKLPSGQPVIVLHGVLKDWCEARGLQARVSVTDETDYAASFVIVEQASAATPRTANPITPPAIAWLKSALPTNDPCHDPSRSPDP